MSTTTTLASTTYIHQSQKKQPLPNGRYVDHELFSLSVLEKHEHQSVVLLEVEIVLVDVTPFGQLSATASPICSACRQHCQCSYTHLSTLQLSPRTFLLVRSWNENSPSMNTSPSTVADVSEMPIARHGVSVS